MNITPNQLQYLILRAKATDYYKRSIDMSKPGKLRDYMRECYSRWAQEFREESMGVLQGEYPPWALIEFFNFLTCRLPRLVA